MVQHRAVRFICDLKDGVSISAAFDNMLELDNLSKRRNKSQHDLLLSILSNEEYHEALSYYSYEELMNTLRLLDMAVTRAVSRGEPLTTSHAKSSAYCNSFLPRTVRKLKTSHY